MQTIKENQNDFSNGSVIVHILNLAGPMMVAQLINVLYNIVDRIYIGRIPNAATLSMTGLGLCLPVISVVTAFANLFGMGGAPLCSIERGRGNTGEAEKIMGNAFAMMLFFGVMLTVAGILVRRPMLYLFGASNQTYPYAVQYLNIYLLGNVFVMTGLGMNSFINSQGFGGTGMMTVLLGAVTNIILDPVFIFVFHMGIQGAALATILSQALSAAWILKFLTGPRAILKLRFSCLRLNAERVGRIVALGLSGFTMSITNGLVQIACNATLETFGGDLYVGVMTVINSIREVITMPIQGITNGSQPVMGYNYGAGKYRRVKQAILFESVSTLLFTGVVWLFLNTFPEFFIRFFNRDEELITAAVLSMRIYYFGFVFQALQFAGQAVFVALGKAKRAVFFSILRKVVIVVPLTFMLPHFQNMGVNGVFAAEPVSNLVGGMACFCTMLATIWPELLEK